MVILFFNRITQIPINKSADKRNTSIQKFADKRSVHGTVMVPIQKPGVKVFAISYVILPIIIVCAVLLIVIFPGEFAIITSLLKRPKAIPETKKKAGLQPLENHFAMTPRFRESHQAQSRK